MASEPFNVDVPLLLGVFVVREVGSFNDNELREMVVIATYGLFRPYRCAYIDFLSASNAHQCSSSVSLSFITCADRTALFRLGSTGLSSVLPSSPAMSKSRHSSVSASYLALITDAGQRSVQVQSNQQMKFQLFSYERDAHGGHLGGQLSSCETGE